MTTEVVEVSTITNVIEVLESPIQLVTEVVSNIVSETTNQYQVIDTTSQTSEVIVATTAREIVEIPTTTNVVEEITSMEVLSETIPVLYGDEEMPYSKRVDFITDDLLYRGEAAPGTLTSQTGWRIRKITIGTDGDVTEQWADGNSQFNKVWDNRLSFTYT